MYIAIAGNIGSGKSILAEMLSQRLGWDNVSLCEGDDQNPYLDDFYENMKEWSFSLQIYFLGMRWRKPSAMSASGSNTIVDRTIYEDAEVFAKNLHNSHLLGNRDLNSYYELYNQVINTIEPPVLLVYLKGSSKQLLKNIKKRGRVYEMAIEKSYLESLGELYEDWTFSYDKSPILTIDIDIHDIASSEQARLDVVEKVIAMLSPKG